MRPTAVIFDLGNVLVAVDAEKARRELRAHRVAPADLRDDDSGAQALIHRFERGELTTAQFREALCRHERISIGHERFCAAYCEIFTPIEEMIEAHAAIRRDGLATYIFSNTSELHFDYIRTRYAFMSQFDGYFLSYEIGCMKPHAGSYEAVERGTGSTPERLVYIDDSRENVEAAKERGWRAIHHTDPALTLSALRAAGLL